MPSPAQTDTGMTGGGMPQAKRRGRPVGSAHQRKELQRKPAREASPASLVMAYCEFLSKHPFAPEPTGLSVELILYRIDLLTANIAEGKTLAQRIATLLGMSLVLADKVVAGAAPITLKMIVVLAEKLETTTDYLLTGCKARAPAGASQIQLDTGEEELLSDYRAGNDTAKAALMFQLALPRLLEALPEEASARVIASLVRLHDAGAQDQLRYLPRVLGAFKARTGCDPLGYLQASTVFTPLHEAWGIYGPEQQPLVRYLVPSEN